MQTSTTFKAEWNRNRFIYPESTQSCCHSLESLVNSHLRGSSEAKQTYSE